MAKVRKPAKRVKAGNSQATAETRRLAFIDAYLLNGRNATQAALAAGYSEKGAPSEGWRLLKNPKVLSILAEREAELAKKAGLSLERTLKEIARLAYSDPRKFFNADGSLKPVNDLDDDTAAALASFEVQEYRAEGTVVGYTKKFKTWDKKSALDMAMRFHGAYATDNAQKQDDAAKTEAVSLLELSRRMLFIMSGAIKELEKT